MNKFIEGDNIKGLEYLLPDYKGKIKLIYIDPPYGTNKKFLYKDKFSSKEEWRNIFMEPLLTAVRLLSDDGFIFVSIDQNRYQQARNLLDTATGDQFVADIAWQGNSSRKNGCRFFSGNSERILVYAKDKSVGKIKGMRRRPEHITPFKNLDNDPRGPYRLTSLDAKGPNTYSDFKYTFPNGYVYTPPVGRHNRWSKKTLDRMIKENRIYYPPNGDGKPRQKTFLSEVSERIRPTTFWSCAEFGNTQESGKELSRIIGKDVFDYPKPVKLIRNIIDMVCDKGDIVLDYFAGSCTTAHAVMELNDEYNMNLEFICIQLPEKTAKGSVAYDNKYKTIAEIGYNRITKTIEKFNYKEVFEKVIL